MKYLVTGGGGFLGKALCLELKRTGHDVVSLSRKIYPELNAQGVNCVQADIAASPEQWAAAFNNIDTVFHVAAHVSMWGKYDDFYRINVLGTRNVLRAAKNAAVKHFVYTSSPSVVADGTDLSGIDESYPYPHVYEAFYPKTKAIAEREVLASNSAELYSLALRPHLIWGPGDTNLIPTVLERAAAGKLVRVGTGKNMVDLTFIDDCVAAHILAAEALAKNPYSRGEAYFISQAEPVSLWDWINQVCIRNGLPPVKRSLPKKLAHMLAGVLEFASRLRPGQPEPLLTRFLVSEMATDHYFNISKAKRDLGYVPRYGMDEAFEVTFPQSTPAGLSASTPIPHGAASASATSHSSFRQSISAL